MTDLEYLLWLSLIIGAFSVIIAVIEWNQKTPPEWVVIVRMWMGRKKK